MKLTSQIFQMGYPIINQEIRSFHYNLIATLSYENETQDSQFLLRNEFLIIQDKYIDMTNLTLNKKIGLQKRSGFELSNKREKVCFLGENELMKKAIQHIQIYTIQRNFEDTYNQELEGVQNAHFLKVVQKFSLKQYFAKKLYKNPTNKKTFYSLKRAMRQISILRAIKNQNLLQLVEVFEDKDVFIVILESLKGGDMQKTLQRQLVMIDEQMVRKIIHGLLVGINHLHQNNIIHRNINAENIYLKERNNFNDPVIINYELAEYFNEENDFDVKKCGTIGYIAPEVLNSKHYNQKIDIFSIGIIMYVLIKGENPFYDRDQIKYFQNNKACKINFESLTVSQPCLDLLKQLLELDPKWRIDSYSALNHQFIQQNDGNSIQNFEITKIPLFQSQQDIKVKVDLQVSISQSAGGLLQEQSPCPYRKVGSIHTCVQLESEEDYDKDTPQFKIQQYVSKQKFEQLF